MGIYAHLLESGWRTPELLSLYYLPGQPRTFGIPLESLRSRGTLCFLYLHVLDLGHHQQSEEQVQAAGAGYLDGEEGIPATAVADGKKPKDYQDEDW